MKPKLAPLGANRVCIACQLAHPRSAFEGRGGKVCRGCRDARSALAKAKAPVLGGAPYTAPELRMPVRPGALDAFALPSRHANQRRFRDGRIEPAE